MTPELKAAVERVERFARKLDQFQASGLASTFAASSSHGLTIDGAHVDSGDLKAILDALAARQWRSIETDPPPNDGTVFDVLIKPTDLFWREADCWVAGDDYPQWRGQIVLTNPMTAETYPVSDAVYWTPVTPIPEPPQEGVSAHG